MNKIRVMIVDDSFFMRKLIRDMLQTDSGIEVVGEADGADAALQHIAELQPDVVTLDIEMPGRNGVDTLRAIVAEPHHPSVIMLSGYPQEGAEMTLECLSLGAADFVIKPSGSFSLDIEKVTDTLLAKIKAAAAADTTKAPWPHVPPAPHTRVHSRTADGVVVIGASTGGPAALETLLPELPSDFPYPVVVAQHLPKEFTASFIERLQKICQLPVALAKDHLRCAPGSLYLASGGTTTHLRGQAKTAEFAVEVNTTDIQTPSVSQLMISAAKAYGAQTIGVLLTGMGDDGLSGMQTIKHAGGTTIVQDAATSVVFGMGREVVQHGAADYIVPLGEVSSLLMRLVK
ncbi:MAG TPA: chemotaxis-specific protein-glutamate methyltransferase CheB [Candidatus Saccharimonadales bacterium]|nr:chemotaxis-specific protein-glutamate methyltransferase CheB [Candidatus Saccharimonadales bacterium]